MTHWKQGPPPDPAPRTAHLQRVPRGKHLVFTCLSRQIAGLWTHWSGSRTEGCRADTPDCPGCRRGLPRRWKGYIHAQDCLSGYTSIVEITPGAARQLLNQRHDLPDLRGLQVRLERTTGAANGRLNAILVGKHPSPDLLPIELDPIATLERLWDQPPTGQAPTLPYNQERRA